MVEELTDANFETAISSGLVVVDFWNEGCPPCDMYAPIFEEVSKVYPDVKFAKIEAREAPISSSKYGVMATPTTLFFKDGQKVDELLGAKSAEELKNKVETHK
jgi:thioredoxin 1